MDIYRRLMKEMEGEIRRDEPMSAHTWLGVGGPADLFVSPRDRDELARGVAILAEEGIPFLVIGNGSNVVVRDKGIRGAVLTLTRALNTFAIDGRIIRAGAGMGLSRLIDSSLDHSLRGLEFAAGIPGTVGGAVKVNAGSHGGEIGGSIRSVDLMDASGETFARRAEDLGFSYRTSLISRDWIILEAEIELEEGEGEEGRRRIAELLGERRRTQPTGRSAGCIFRNPKGAAAGMLIDRAGLKGLRVGGARVSERHANFILTEPGASADDVIDLITQVREQVERRSGVELELEVEIVGQD